MAYTWTNGEVITAEKLNQTGGSGGGGIFKVTVTATNPDNTEFTADKFAGEIYEAWQSGLLPVVEIFGDLLAMPRQIDTTICTFIAISPNSDHTMGLSVIDIDEEYVDYYEDTIGTKS